MILMILVGLFLFLGKYGSALISCLLIPGIWSVAMCEDYVVIPYGSLAVISFDIITGDIVVVDCFARCVFAPESAISSMFLLGKFCGS